MGKKCSEVSLRREDCFTMERSVKKTGLGGVTHRGFLLTP